MLTDIRTDGRTDRPSYRDARTHLKREGGLRGGEERYPGRGFVISEVKEETNLPLYSMCG